MVPNGWKLKSFEKAGIKVVDGDRGKEYPKSTDFHDDGYCLFLSAKNVTKKGFLFEENQFISEDKHLRLRKGIVNRGDVVLTTRGSVGNFAFYNSSVPFNCLRINSGMVTLDSSESSIDRDYFYTVCRSHLIGNQIDAVAFGSAQPQLTVKLIKNLKLPVPPLPEQQKIAKILATWDKAIATTEQLIATSQQQKKALMQQLLTGKKRLVNPETGKVFEGDWEEHPLQYVLDKIIDYRGQSVPKAQSGVALITARNVRMGYLDFSSQEYIDENQFSSWMTRGTPQAGDILFTTEAPLGMACRFPTVGIFGVGQRTVTLRVNSKLNSDFLLYYLLSPKGQLLIDLRSSGSTAKGIKSSELKKVKIYYPRNCKEQQKIASVLTAADKEIELLEAKLAHLKDEKKALMQQLLTGKRRVNIDDMEAA